MNSENQQGYNFGLRLKERRIALGLTLKNVADELEVQEATAQRYESGVIKGVNIKKLEPLAKVLKTSIGYILGLTDDPDFIPEIFLRNKRESQSSPARQSSDEKLPKVTAKADDQPHPTTVGVAGQYLKEQIEQSFTELNIQLEKLASLINAIKFIQNLAPADKAQNMAADLAAVAADYITAVRLDLNKLAKICLFNNL